MPMSKQQKVQKLLLKVNKSPSNAGAGGKLIAAEFAAENTAAVVSFAKTNLADWVNPIIAPLQVVEVSADKQKTSPFNDVLIVTVEHTAKKNSKVSFKCHVDIGQALATSKTKGEPKRHFNGLTVRVPSFHEANNAAAGLLSQNTVKVLNGGMDSKKLSGLFKTAYDKAKEIARAEHNRVKSIIKGRQSAFELNSKFRAMLAAAGIEVKSESAVRAYCPMLADGNRKWSVMGQDFSIKFDGLSDDDKLNVHVLLAANGFSDLLKPLPGKDTEYDSVMDEGLPLYDVFEKYYPVAVAERKAAIAKRFSKEKK